MRFEIILLFPLKGKFIHINAFLSGILFLILAFLSCNQICAQEKSYKQDGKIYLYQGRYNTKPFTQLVTLDFKNASTTTSNINGEFTIDCKHLKPGQTLGNFKFTTKQPLLIFNEKEINNWILPTKKRNMDILLCTRPFLNSIENAYINSHEAQLKKQIKQQKEELIKTYEKINTLTNYNQELDIQLKKLDEKYKEEFENIKKRATIFAYVDERNIDSLEYAFRQCILRGEMDLAITIGQQLSEDTLIDSRIQNAKTAVDKAVLEIQKLKNITAIQETYLKVCQSSIADEFGHFEDEEHCYSNLIRLYEELIDLHGPNKMSCDSKTMSEWKQRLGYLYYIKAYSKNDYDCYKRAAELGNLDALLSLFYDEEDYNQSKKLIKNCVDVCKEGEYKYIDKDFLNDLYESYPDFYDVHKGDTLYYHILNDKEVSLVFFVHGNKKSTEVIIPERIKHKGTSYDVTKIGINAFGDLKYWASSETHVMSLGLFKQNSPFPTTKKWDGEMFYGTDSLTKIKLPNTITYIGYGAFMNVLEPKCLEVNIPKNIKTIHSFAFLGCKFDNTVIIPEGAISVGLAWGGDSLHIVLPSTLENLEDFHAHTLISRDYVSFADIKVHPANQHFMSVNGVLYKKDGTELYPLSLKQNRNNKVLYIPKNLYVNSYEWYDINSLLMPDSISIEDECKNYSLYNGILYNMAQDTLIMRPTNVSHVILPPSFKCKLSPISFCNIKALHIPNEISPSILWGILDNDFDNDCNIVYDAIDTPKVLDECMKLAEMQDNVSSLSYLNLSTLLRKYGYMEQAETVLHMFSKKQLQDYSIE